MNTYKKQGGGGDSSAFFPNAAAAFGSGRLLGPKSGLQADHLHSTHNSLML
jgi:hypothetical protein